MHHQHFKLKFRVFARGLTVTMVTCISRRLPRKQDWNKWLLITGQINYSLVTACFCLIKYKFPLIRNFQVTSQCLFHFYLFSLQFMICTNQCIFLCKNKIIVKLRNKSCNTNFHKKATKLAWIHQIVFFLSHDLVTVLDASFQKFDWF